MKAAVAQIGSVLFDTPATMARVEQWCRSAAEQGAELVVLPEALIGGYPKLQRFGATVGQRTEAGRDLFLRYFRAAIDIPGPETTQLTKLATALNLHIVIGVIERDGSTLYCTSLLVTPQGDLTKHRKLMPTATERLLWGQGDGTTMQVTPTSAGRIGMAICWENYMPLYRQHLYNQAVELWCAPTVDTRDMWLTTMRHIAYEGRCFVLSACHYLTKEDWPKDMRDEAGTIDGGSVIVAPNGDILVGPRRGEGLLIADINLDEIPRGKFDLDVAGHYSRPDIFQFKTRQLL